MYPRDAGLGLFFQALMISSMGCNCHSPLVETNGNSFETVILAITVRIITAAHVVQYLAQGGLNTMDF